MSPSLELQVLLYETLARNAGLIDEIAGRVYDRVSRNTAGAVTATFPYVSLGASDYVPDDADCIVAGVHTIQIDVWSRAVGYPECKRITDLVKRALHDATLTLDDNALAFITVERVQFMREADGLTSHGIVIVRALVEES